MSICLIQKNILAENKEIIYIYRETPVSEGDSGWRLFSEKKADRIIHDFNEVQSYELDYISNLDKSLYPYMLNNKPFNSAYEKIDGKWKFINDDTTPEKERVYFKNLKDVHPVHYDCVMGTLILPWNNQTISCYLDTNGTYPMYRPDVPAPYHSAMFAHLPQICVERGYFTKKELTEYYEESEKEYQEEEYEDNLRQNKIEEIYTKLQELDSEIANSCTHTIYKIAKGLYELTYRNNNYIIHKYLDDNPHKRYFWNMDESFETIESDDFEYIFSKFYELIKN